MIACAENVVLRPLELSDIDTCYTWDNSIDGFNSHTQQYSKFTLEKYIEHAHQSLFEALQYRFVIVNTKKPQEVLGFIDLSDYHPIHSRVEIGILVLPEYRGKKVAQAALIGCMKYLKQSLRIQQAYCFVLVENRKALRLFEKIGFENSGLLMDWKWTNGEWKDAYILQNKLST